MDQEGHAFWGAFRDARQDDAWGRASLGIPAAGEWEVPIRTDAPSDKTNHAQQASLKLPRLTAT
jgi:hypothetical protein